MPYAEVEQRLVTLNEWHPEQNHEVTRKRLKGMERIHVLGISNCGMICQL